MVGIFKPQFRLERVPNSRCFRLLFDGQEIVGVYGVHIAQQIGACHPRN